MMIGGHTRRAGTGSDLRGHCVRAIGESGVRPDAEGTAGTAEHGYLHCGPGGAGHFVKMVHNGIEYGLMAAYAEGMSILQTRQHRRAASTTSTPRPRRCATRSTTVTS